MYKHLVLLMLCLGIVTAAYAAERVVVCEFAYSEG
jgi:hypothetical protein